VTSAAGTTPPMPRVVHEFRKNAHERVVVSVQPHEGVTYMDLRAHTRGVDGVLRPTRKGLTLRAECIADLVRAVEALRAEVVE